MNFQPHRKPHGFTLIESLVVMLTIILLASIIIPGLLGRGGREPEIPKPLPSVEKSKEVEDAGSAVPSAPPVAEGEAERPSGSPPAAEESPAPVSPEP